MERGGWTAPRRLHDDLIDISRKLYELNGQFYEGPPNDGSIRPADLPPFLAGLIAGHLDRSPSMTCTCTRTEPPWCPGAEYIFLGPGGGHFRRSNYSERFIRPAPTAGIPPGRAGARARQARCW